jgi:hypothetical protein
MVFFLMESTFLLNILKRHVKFEHDIKLVSLKGNIYSYFLDEKGNIKYIIKEDKKELVNFFSSIDKKENTIIIASDQDPAGELIAYETASLFKNANLLRFTKPVEFLLMEKFVTKDKIFQYTTSKINVLKAVRYLEEKFLSDYNNEKLKVLNVLAKKNIAKIRKKEI